MNALRYRIKRLFTDEKLLKHACKKRILYIMHESSGGTPATSLDLEVLKLLIPFLPYLIQKEFGYILSKMARESDQAMDFDLRWRITDFSRDDYKNHFEILPVTISRLFMSTLNKSYF